jgi:hypothetical protein
MTYVIALPCVDLLDKTCIDQCPVDCEPVCPVEAISFETHVPDQWKGFYWINAEFFQNLGSPGGASKVGKIRMDHPVVAALPRRR